jgi:hypothetical protein
VVFTVLADDGNVDGTGIKLVDFNPGVGEVIRGFMMKRAHFLTYSAAATSWKLVIDIEMHRFIHLNHIN